MSGASSNAARRTGATVSAGKSVWLQFIDEDPLRAYREARELTAELGAAGVGVEFARRAADPAEDAASDKGGPVVDVIALGLSSASLGVAVLQTWLTRTPSRQVRVERGDGAVLVITGRQAESDATLVERFLSPTGDGGPDPVPDRDPDPQRDNADDTDGGS